MTNKHLKNKKAKIKKHINKLNTNLKIKRLLDLTLIVVMMPVLIPVFLVIALLIKLDSKGPIFYISKRVGKNGKDFNFYKFRSMVVDAEELKESLSKQNEAKDNVLFKIKDDPRITKIGKILRKTSLDELPQLINVLIGNMSLVGPRPPIRSEVDNYKLFQHKRLHFTPGITCLWQISGRSNIPFEQQVQLDLKYIKNYSVYNDIKILFATIPAVIKGDGAY